MSETENAYTCLTQIQGCESFHLSPESSLEEIQRAYDVLSDPQRRGVYDRLTVFCSAVKRTLRRKR